MNNFAKTLEEISVLARDWQGCRAQVWEYWVGHSQLLIRLCQEDPNDTSSLFIWCKNCEHVDFSPHWVNSTLDISTLQGKHGVAWLVQDAGNLSVSCGAVFAFVSDYSHGVCIRDLTFGLTTQSSGTSV